MNGFQGWTFDARTVKPQIASFEPVPDGWYKVIVAKSNIKPTRDPANSMLALELTVVEGQFQNRKIFWNFNLFHSTSSDAVRIAYEELSALQHVIGVFNIGAVGAADSVVPMLHNLPFYVQTVSVKGERGTNTNVKGVRDVNGNEPGKQAAGPPAQQPAPAPAVSPQSSFGVPGGYAPDAPAAPAGAPQWGAPPQQPAPGPAPQAPAATQWQAPQPAPGPAPGAAPPPAQQWGAPAQQPAAPQQPAPGPAPGQPQQTWQPPGQAPGGPPQGAAPWGR